MTSISKTCHGKYIQTGANSSERFTLCTCKFLKGIDHILKELNLFGLDEILPQLKCLENIIIM